MATAHAEERLSERLRPRTGARARNAAHARVLLVEDDQDLRELLAMSLEDHGFEVVHVGSSFQAQQLLCQPPSFGCAVVDLNLPWMSGSDLILFTRMLVAPAPPFIVITGEDLACPAGAVALLRKPFDVDDLAMKIRDAMVADVATSD